MKKNEKLLIVVDMVNGFVKEGIMADRTIGHIIPEQIKLVKQFLKKNNRVIFIKDVHDKNAVEFKTFPEHCVKGTYEAELVDELKQFENDVTIYEKNSTSAMFADNFIKDINNITDLKTLKEIVVVGCCTDICVLNLALPLKNYLNQINKDIKISVPMNMVETYNADNHNRFIYNEIAFMLLNQAGIELTNKNEYEEYMKTCGVNGVDIKTLGLRK